MIHNRDKIMIKNFKRSYNKMCKIFKTSILIVFLFSSKAIFSQTAFWERTSAPSALIYSLAVANNGDVWAGGYTAGGGVLYLSTNNGDIWSQKGSFQSGISSIAINSTGYVFAGTENDGLYLSIDNGGSWIKLDILNNPSHIYTILIKPQGGIYLGTDIGIYYSNDNGYPGTWVEKNSGLMTRTISSLALGTDGTLYAGTSGVYRSTNGGDVWLRLPSSDLYYSYVEDLAISGDGSIFATASSSGVLKSTDKGLTWTQVNTGLSSEYNAYRVIYNPVTQHLIVGFYERVTKGGIYISNNLGEKWYEINNGFLGITYNWVSAFAVNPTTGMMFAGTSGFGVYRSVRFSTPFIYTDIDTLEFSTTYGGSLPTSKSFLVANIGTGTLNWSATESATWFDITPTSGTNSGSIAVSINSTTALLPGVHYQNIRINAPNAGTSSPKDIVVKYTIFGATINVISDIDFATVVLGNKRDTSFTITNTGNIPLTINSIQIGGDDTDFVLGAVTFPVSIPVNGNRTFTVSFIPQSLGAKNATLTINHNITGKSPTTITLQGHAIEPIPIININPLALNFGDVIIGTLKDLSVSLENKGGAKLTIDSLIVIGANADMFILDSPTLPYDITPSSKYDLSVSFNPTLLGTKSAMLMISHNAEDSPYTVILSGNGVKPEIVIIPDTLDFGDVSRGGNSTKYFQIRNDGTAALVISSIVKEGTDATQFNRYSNPDSANSQIIVVAGQIATVNVRFTPTSNGQKNSYWIFNHNADSSQSRLYLKGNGISPIIVIDFNSINFGDLNVGSSLQRSLKITNSGTAPLVISSVSISGDVFRLTNNETTITIAPGNYHELAVQFLPTANITYNGSITLIHNATGSPTNIQLSGNGLSSSIVVDPTNIDFYDVLVSTSITKTFKITNGGNANLVISSFNFVGIDSGLFSLTSNLSLPITLTSSQSVDLTVQFLPTSLGIKNAELDILNNATTVNVPLTGRGVQPSISLNPNDIIDFGGVTANSSSSDRYINISNVGTAPLFISNLQITGADASMFKRVSSPDSSVFQNITIAAGSNFVFTFNFTPLDSGVKNAKIIFTHALGASEISLTGLGLVSGISVTPNPLDFGDIEIVNYKDLPLVIRNTGNTNVRVNSFVVSGANVTLFSRFSNPDSSTIGFTLTPSTTYTVTIRFKPDVPGTKNAILDVVTNIINFNIALNGRGTGGEISVKEPTDVTSENNTFLFQSNPNPVRAGSDAAIKYRINVAGEINLIVYDLLGREVSKIVNEYKSQGLYSVSFNTRDLPSGIYFYRLRAPGYEAIKKMIIIH
jgi:photosystem II stability/assembly factor-like uncharacterized protein